MQDDDSEDDYDERDRRALRRALSIRFSSVQGKLEMLNLLASRSWGEVAERAAYSCQIRALALLPWQQPPCRGDGYHKQPEAAALLARMLRAGVSRFEPDPAAALAKAEAKHK